MAILAGFMVPHPPMIVPAVGRGSEKQVEKTIRAYEQTADEIAALQPETIIITSPHSVMYSDYFHISPGRSARGDFGQFRAAQVRFEEEYDVELAAAVTELARREGFPAGPLGERDKKLDHGTMVPLYFIRAKYSGARIVRIGLSGLPLTEHYKLGQMIRKAADQLGPGQTFPFREADEFGDPRLGERDALQEKILLLAGGEYRFRIEGRVFFGRFLYVVICRVSLQKRAEQFVKRHVFSFSAKYRLSRL